MARDFRKLYEITQDLEAIGAALVDAGGELTPELEVALSEIEGEFDIKVERVALLAREFSELAAEADAEARRLTALKTVRSNAAARLKRYLLDNLVAAGKQSVTTGLCRVRRQRNGQASITLPADTAPLVDLGVAEAHTVTTYPVDKAKVLEAWGTDGGRALLEAAGVVVERGEHLRIE